MSRPISKRTSNRFQPTDPDIQTLQTRLLESLNSAFDPLAADKTDDFFLAKEYVFETPIEPLSNAFKSAKNPYQTLTDKAKDYVEKARAERPVRAKTTIAMNKRSDTFLTYLDMEKKEIAENPPPVKEEEELPYVSDENIIGDIHAEQKLDDLEELRRMIRQTKKEMGDYGRELLNLKNDILDINSFASRELGFMANQDLLTSVEDTIGTLKNKNMYTYKKKNDSKLKNLKSLGQKIEEVNEKRVYKRTSSIGTTASSLGTTAGPANFRVKSGVGKAMRPPSYRGPVKKG